MSMKRFTSILVAVILGALATGVGTVPFLVLANQDRHRLDLELNRTKNLAAETEAEKRRIAEQANQKVKEANEEVQRAQSVILEAREDERLLAVSERLNPPPVYERSKWNSAISLTQGVSFSVPSSYSTTQDDTSGFILSRDIKQTADIQQLPLIFVEPYDAKKEMQHLNSFASSTDVYYVAGGRLLKGKQGILLDGSAAMALEVRASAKTTHLIWMRDPDGTLSLLKKILSTIQYQ